MNVVVEMGGIHFIILINFINLMVYILSFSEYYLLIASIQPSRK